MGNTMLGLFAVMSALSAVPAAAQDRRPPPSAEFAAGTYLFADEEIIPEGFVGGAARLYLSPRFSVGPEISMVSGQGHSHVILTGNLAIDLVAPKGPMRPRAVPFVVMGAGLFQTSEDSPFTSQSSTRVAFTAGGGVRVSVGRRAFVGGDVRLGLETAGLGMEAHIRLNGVIGVHFGR